MAAKMETTRSPGIYKRGSRYVVVYRVNGKQHKESARTFEEARRLKAARTTDRDRGEFFEASQETFEAFASEWIERYQGRGRGFREATRRNYRADLKRAYRFFGSKRLCNLNPRDFSNYVAWLMDEREQGQALSDATIRNALKPVRAALDMAVAEGLIRTNPAARVILPHREKVTDADDDSDEGDARVLSVEQLTTFLAIVHPKHRLMCELIATTGLRISEAIGLEWRHVELDTNPRLKVRLQWSCDSQERLPLKTRYSKRDIPLSPAVAARLRAHKVAADDPSPGGIVFPTGVGTHLRRSNLSRRVLKPAAEEVGAPWASWHTLRHTCASLLFARGANAVQVQRWLGHHSAAFTLQRYVHLLPGELGEALDLSAEAARRGQQVATLATQATETDVDAEVSDLLELAA